jgi:undecaprenyl-phosphate galactose phosphotransferase
LKSLQVRKNTRLSSLKFLNDAQISYAVIPPVTNMNMYHMEPHYFFGQDIMVMHNKKAMFTPAARFAKRAMDICISVPALVVLMPLMALVALALKIEGQGGSVFYAGPRMGRAGRMFKCWKFRSMEPDTDHRLYAYLEANPEAMADWEKYRKLRNDPRISTRTAAFIRKASIDELPQLWNVLKGDMSIVGPRPILQDEQDYFGDKLSDYKSVRPGITGLWQVSGRNDASFDRRVYWDSWYVRNWSLWGDIVILFKTLSVLATRRGAH